MSRFFATGDTDSSSSEESDFEEEVAVKPVPTTAKYSLALDSDDEDERRVVKSKEQKQAEKLAEYFTKIRNKQRIGDWAEVEEAYNALHKLLSKQQQQILTEGPPRGYIKSVVELHDAVEAAFPSRKKLAKPVAQALNRLRGSLKKTAQTFKLDDRIAAFRANPDQEEEEPEAAPDSPSAEAQDKPEKKVKAPKAAKDDDDDESSDWPSESSDSDDDDGTDMTQMTKEELRAMFLKKTTDDKKVAKKPKQPKKPKAQKEEVEDDDGMTKVLSAKERKEKKFLFGKEEEVTVEAVLKKLVDIQAGRGKKGSSPNYQMRMLGKLREIADQNKLGLPISLKLLTHIISSYFDAPLSVAGFMKTVEWHRCHDAILELLVTLNENKNIRISPDVTEDAENFSDESKPFAFRGNVVNFVERLDDEYVKSLQNIDPHAPEYVERLRDECVLYNVIVLAQKYFEALEPQITEALPAIQIRRVEYIYYKRTYVEASPKQRDEARQKLYEEAKEEDDEAVPFKNLTEAWYVDNEEEKDMSALMFALCKSLYGRYTTDRIRTRAMLCQVYHEALNNNWYKARDLMLMSHLQENIAHSDVSTQILYNRTMVQLGLCAFRQGRVWDAHSCLHDIWSGGRVKELLAQGIQHQKYSDKTPEETKIEKRRQVPFHMHITMELIESVYYVCSMLLEIPHVAHGRDPKRVLAKAFRRQLDYYARQTFQGPPENTRDHIMAAALAMQEGNWRRCSELVLGLKVWNLLPETDALKEMLKEKIQEETLRTYLFAYSGFYESMSLVTLSEMFELPESAVHSVVSKMIIGEELQASHDQPTKTIVIHKTEPTPLQQLALQFADKVGSFVETNERLLDTRNGGYNYKDRQPWQNNQNRRGGYRSGGGGGGSGGGGYQKQQSRNY